MFPHKSLRAQFMLLGGVYTVLLIGCLLGFYYLSGRATIRDRAESDAAATTGLIERLLEKEIDDSFAELWGLRSNLARLWSQDLPVPEVQALVRQFIAAYPGKYSRLTVWHSGAGLLVTARPVRELGEIHCSFEVSQGPLAEPDLSLRPPESGAGRLLRGPDDDSPEHLVQLSIPVRSDPAGFVAAAVPVPILLEKCLGKVALPADTSVAFANQAGLVVHASELAWLEQPLDTVMAGLHLRRLPQAAGGSGAASAGDRAARLVRLRQPALSLLAVRELGPELAGLDRNLLGLLLFSLLLAVAALGLGWILTGRMAVSLREMADVALRVAHGDFTRKIRLERRDELGLLIGTFNDMTGRLQVSYRNLHALNRKLSAKVAELRRTRRILSQKQRLALMGEAISKISHEIQNKIGGVSVWVQNLERCGARDETVRMFTGELKAALASFMEMLIDFKRFYRHPELRPTPVTAGELMTLALETVQAGLAEKQLFLVRDTSGDATVVSADREQLAAALANILFNAVYFSPEQGELRVGTRTTGRWLLFSVGDRGPGLDPSVRRKVFQPFFTTKPSGSGLGLAMVSNIVLAHGGRVRCRNRPGGGALFQAGLPLPPPVRPGDEPR